MYRFVIGDALGIVDINTTLLDLMKTHPEFFYDDFEITAVFGCPPNCIWNGGTTQMYSQPPFDREMLRAMYHTYNDRGIEYRLTLTNHLLQENHMLDTYGNAILDEGNNTGFKNKVLYNLPVVKEYVQKNYPNFGFVRSITSGLNSLEEVDELSKDEVVVLPTKFNKDFEGLKKLHHPENIEILCNQMCIDFCPYNDSHYLIFDKKNLYGEMISTKCKFSDIRKKLGPHYPYGDRKLIVRREDLPKYEELGITMFKLAGRPLTYGGEARKTVIGYLHLFVKKEYQDIVKTLLLAAPFRSQFPQEIAGEEDHPFV